MPPIRPRAPEIHRSSLASAVVNGTPTQELMPFIAALNTPAPRDADATTIPLNVLSEGTYVASETPSHAPNTCTHLPSTPEILPPWCRKNSQETDNACFARLQGVSFREWYHKHGCSVGENDSGKSNVCNIASKRNSCQKCGFEVE